MHCHHHTCRKSPLFHSLYHIICRLIHPTFLLPFRCSIYHFISTTDAIPTPSCVGQIHHFTPIYIHLWLTYQPQFLIIIFLPHLLRVKPTHWRPVHRNCPHINHLTHLFYIARKSCIRLIHISSLLHQFLIMIPHLMSSFCKKLNHMLAIQHHIFSQIIRRLHLHSPLFSSHIHRTQHSFIHIMPHHHQSFCSLAFAILCISHKLIPRIFQCQHQLTIF